MRKGRPPVSVVPAVSWLCRAMFGQPCFPRVRFDSGCSRIIPYACIITGAGSGFLLFLKPRLQAFLLFYFLLWHFHTNNPGRVGKVHRTVMAPLEMVTWGYMPVAQATEQLRIFSQKILVGKRHHLIPIKTPTRHGI